jgi:hypothetical protein
VTPREILKDSMSAPARALDWLVYEDMNTENVETMRTRFALATLYFETQKPSAGDSWTNDRHWLSSDPVCLWHGVECLDEHTTTGLVKSLNLSSNGLTGTLPDEIGLLEADIRSLDVSNNAIAGTIPETLFLMKNLGKFEGNICIIPCTRTRLVLLTLSHHPQLTSIWDPTSSLLHYQGVLISLRISRIFTLTIVRCTEQFQRRSAGSQNFVSFLPNTFHIPFR